MKRKIGFTLVELLVVISIIGVLIGLALVSFGGVQKQSRDTQRKSDLNQYRNAMENYGVAHDGLYISRGQWQNLDGTNVCENVGEGGPLYPVYISECLVDPQNVAPYKYKYISDGVGSGKADAKNYLMYADLEIGGCWVVCSDGRSFEQADTPTDGSPCF